MGERGDDVEEVHVEKRGLKGCWCAAYLFHGKVSLALPVASTVRVFESPSYLHRSSKVISYNLHDSSSSCCCTIPLQEKSPDLGRGRGGGGAVSVLRLL
jgi:hypothetical protein